MGERYDELRNDMFRAANSIYADSDEGDKARRVLLKRGGLAISELQADAALGRTVRERAAAAGVEPGRVGDELPEILDVLARAPGVIGYARWTQRKDALVRRLDLLARLSPAPAETPESIAEAIDALSPMQQMHLLNKTRPAPAARDGAQEGRRP